MLYSFSGSVETYYSCHLYSAVDSGYLYWQASVGIRAAIDGLVHSNVKSLNYSLVPGIKTILF